MSEVKEKLLHMILKQYNYKIYKIRLERSKGRAVWWVDTDKGLMILKKLCRPEPRTKFILLGMQHLKKKGLNIPEIYPNIENKMYTKYNGSCYILMEVIQGRPPRYDNKHDLKAIVKELGKFHHASRGFISPLESKSINLLGTWPDIFLNGLNILKRVYNCEKNKKTNTEFNNIILNEIPQFINRIENLILLLNNSKYFSWVEKARISGSLCHLDYARYNLRIDSSGKVHIFDFDTLALELPVIDIRKLIYHVFYTNLFNQDTIENVLRWYQKCNPLSEDEWSVVKLFFIYPFNIPHVLDKYYFGIEKKQNKEEIINLIIKAINTENKMSLALKDYDVIVKKLIQA